MILREESINRLMADLQAGKWRNDGSLTPLGSLHS